MTTVMVYDYKWVNPSTGIYRIAHRMGTIAAIESIHGTPIIGTCRHIAADWLDLSGFVRLDKSFAARLP